MVTQYNRESQAFTFTFIILVMLLKRSKKYCPFLKQLKNKMSLMENSDYIRQVRLIRYSFFHSIFENNELRKIILFCFRFEMKK